MYNQFRIKPTRQGLLIRGWREGGIYERKIIHWLDILAMPIFILFIIIFSFSGG